MATWEWDADRRALDCSETFGPLFGLPHGAAFTTFAELLERTHPDDRSLLVQARNILYRGGRVREILWRVLLPDGEIRWVEARMQAERDRGWWLKRVAGVIAEAEEPVRVEKPADDAMAGEEEMGEADEAGTEEAETEEITAVDLAAAETALGDVEVGVSEDHLLDLSSLVAAWSPSFRKYTVGTASLHLRLAPGIASVFGDANSLHAAVLELVKNAAEGLDTAGGVISLATGTVEATRAFLASAYFDDGLPPGRYAYIEVSDTGRGMDAASVSRIFEPDYTTHGTGRGAGLAMVLAVVRAHHGADPGVQQARHRHDGASAGPHRDPAPVGPERACRRRRGPGGRDPRQAGGPHGIAPRHRPRELTRQSCGKTPGLQAHLLDHRRRRGPALPPHRDHQSWHHRRRRLRRRDLASSRHRRTRCRKSAKRRSTARRSRRSPISRS
jgi:signal transduction histidine kinase